MELHHWNEASGRASGVRLGFNYVRGLRKEPAEAIVAARPFSSIDDLVRRVPELRKDELRMLAEIGALNSARRSSPRCALAIRARHLAPPGPLARSIWNPPSKFRRWPI